MIDGIGRNQPPQIFTPANTPATSAAAPDSPGGVVDNRVTASSLQLSGVARDLAAAAPVDAARVAALRLAIADGSYKVDPDAIAARMIAFDRGSAGA